MLFIVLKQGYHWEAFSWDFYPLENFRTAMENHN